MGEAAPNTLGLMVRQRRLELGWTQEELAQRIGDGVRQADVSRLERGGVGLPRRERLMSIAAALELTPGELLVRSGWAGASGLAAQPIPVEPDPQSDPLERPGTGRDGSSPTDDATGVVASFRSPRPAAGIEQSRQTLE